MGILADGLTHYLATTPREQILADWEAVAEFDNVKPSIDYIIEQTETNFMKSREQWLAEEPKKETYGWTDRGGFDDEQHGWCIEGGEEAYDEACKGWRNRWSHKIAEGIHEAMEKNKVLISVYNNASGFLWSMMMCPGGTDLGWADVVGRPGTNDGGAFDSWNEAAQDALNLLGDYTLDEFEATRNEHKHSWSEFVHYLGKLEKAKKS